jgi:hypothetical protein
MRHISLTGYHAGRLLCGLPRGYRETNAPAGGYFCRWVSVQPLEFCADSFIVGIEHRHDI